GQEGGFEILGRAARARDVGAGRGQALDRAGQVDGDDQVAHHITSISACRAPAARMAWRMEIMSRGLTPRAFRPLTRSDREALSATILSSRPRSSSMKTSDCGTTTVWPSEKGAGWLTAGDSWMLMVR